MKLFIFFLLSVLHLIPLSPIYSASMTQEEDIFIKLESENPLLPLYLNSFSATDSGFELTYINQLEKILQFDLNHNGMTYLVKPNSAHQLVLNQQNFNHSLTTLQWKKLGVYYAAFVEIKHKNLSLHLHSSQSATIKTLNQLALTGQLAQDRKIIHLLADTIHQALFNVEGIASTSLLFTVKKKGEASWLSDVWEADYDGGNARQITHAAGYCVSPVYIPSKTGFKSGSFLYVSYLNGQPKIFYASLQNGSSQRLSYLRGNQLMPAISNQRNQIAFISDVAGNPDLFLQQFDSEKGAQDKPWQIFSSHRAVQGTPTFSPDGKQLAFVSNKDGCARIYTMTIPITQASLKTTSTKLISKQSTESTAPAWAPDGTKLAYCAMTKGVRQIWIYDFAKNEEYQLTQSLGHKENPAWAPNSLHLVFNSTDHRDSELYLVNLNQPKPIKILTIPGEKHYPSWERR